MFRKETMCISFRNWDRSDKLTLAGLVIGIVGAIIAYFTYQESLKPYIGPAASTNANQFALSPEQFPGDFKVLTEATIKNYGHLPAYFSAHYSTSAGQTDTSGIQEGYLIPDQTFKLLWTEKPTTSNCAEISKRQIKIDYGYDAAHMPYSVTLSPSAVQLPTRELLLEFAKRYDISETCYDANGNYLYVWRIKEMTY